MIGDNDGYDIALFIDRTLCKIHYVLKVLRLQIMWTRIYKLTRSVAIVDKKGTGPYTDVRPHKELKQLESDMIEAIKLSEGLVEKRRDVKKDNIRRTIGLYLWDVFNQSDKEVESEESFIKDTIEMLEEEHSFVLEYYRHGYKNLGGTGEAYRTVCREMRKDCDLADYCIKELDFFTPNQFKKARKKSVCSNKS